MRREETRKPTAVYPNRDGDYPPAHFACPCDLADSERRENKLVHAARVTQSDFRSGARTSVCTRTLLWVHD